MLEPLYPAASKALADQRKVLAPKCGPVVSPGKRGRAVGQGGRTLFSYWITKGDG
jgi:hypothetical protein